MRGLSWFAPTAAALLLLDLTATKAQSQAKVKAGISNVVQVSSKIGPSTCASRSLNYITQTLPQQCLTTSWASKSASQEKSTDNEAPISSDSHERSTEVVKATVAATTPQVATFVKATSLSPTSGDATTTINSSPEVSTVPPAVEYESTTVDSSKVDQQTETDSPLDNANFLSFEEWKRQNLAKAGQSAENLGARAGSSEPRRRPGGLNNALDSLGEDTEIEIDFGGFVNPGSSQPGSPSARPGVHEDISRERRDTSRKPTADENSGARERSKDAGKTCKERSNYASFDCAATMLKTNVESKGSNAVLVENRDTYMLNVCSAKNKFFIVELCDDILIDTVVLANFEFFSSMFRTFRVSVSDRYPVKPDKWKDLGTYEARNSREVQAFLVENPLIWARYLRIEMLTHFGNEYYCPLSLLRVHGTTMMEEFNHDLKRIGTEEDGENESGENEDGESSDSSPGMVSTEMLKDKEEQSSSQATQITGQKVRPSTTTLDIYLSNGSILKSIATVTPDAESICSPGFATHNFSISKQMEDLLAAIDSPSDSCAPEDKSADSTPSPSIPRQTRQPQNTEAAQAREPMNAHIPPRTNDTATTKVSKLAEPSASVAQSTVEKGSAKHGNDSARPSNQTSATAAKTQSSSTQPPNANPTTQESFFKSVHKRLQLLESNSTLSLQYIEEQSRILRDAFSIVEKRQLAKTTTFLETLNATVLTELRDFRNQYDQIWQSTVLELSSQREQSQLEVMALSARLSLLADEIFFHKRMVILQFILILLCLGLAIFSRTGSTATYLELPPLVQNAINRSSMSLSRYTPQFETPPASPSSTRPPTRHGLLRGWTHQRERSDESQMNGAHDGTKSPSIACSPPTPPTSQSSPGDHGDGVARADGEELSDESLLAGEGAVREVKSSPATPSGQREQQREFVGDQSLRPDAGREKWLH